MEPQFLIGGSHLIQCLLSGRVVVAAISQKILNAHAPVSAYLVEGQFALPPSAEWHRGATHSAGLPPAVIVSSRPIGTKATALPCAASWRIRRMKWTSPPGSFTPAPSAPKRTNTCRAPLACGMTIGMAAAASRVSNCAGKTSDPDKSAEGSVCLVVMVRSRVQGYLRRRVSEKTTPKRNKRNFLPVAAIAQQQPLRSPL